MDVLFLETIVEVEDVLFFESNYCWVASRGTITYPTWGAWKIFKIDRLFRGYVSSQEGLRLEKKTGFGKTRTVKERLAWHGGDTQLGGIVGKSPLKNTKNRVTISLFRNEERAPGCSGEKQGTFFYTVTWGYNKTVVKIPIKKPAWWKARVFFFRGSLVFIYFIKIQNHSLNTSLWDVDLKAYYESLTWASPSKTSKTPWVILVGSCWDPDNGTVSHIDSIINPLVITTWNPKQPFINGCFNGMIPNLYIENGCFTKHPFINGCLGYQV